MTTKEKIEKLIAGLEYNTGFEDVSNEPSYVVDEIIKIVEETYSQAITDAVGVLKLEKRECGNHGLDKINGTLIECYGYDETVNEALDKARASLEALKK